MFDIIEIKIEDKEYPIELKQISNPPKKLFCVGNLSLLSKRKIGIVGSRRMSISGEKVAMNLAKILSERDVAVVAGLAKGIDKTAHEEALNYKGKTIAVLGTGINNCYPSSNIALRNRIAEYGLIISIFPNDFHGAKWSFPQRNRIVSAICESIVVVEAKENSGALITASFAGEMGKDVYVVPGSITNKHCLGSNKLLRDGAMPLVVLEDLLVDMHIDGNSLDLIKTEIGYDEKKVYDVLCEYGECTVDEISERTKMSVGNVNGIITVLEIKGIANTSLGKVFIAK